ncbi:hypothetical protein [Persicirhabdus sediminis]|uniref:Uncharacterized protein n=1 Tax=Persicirhabdus sediminis TaxID=454144 RepID=A0A8J7ME57_9BACT|nr:hypothetical protein [Persicirhabdus sediminis]MBK1791702.1 hypothetical protein [Persicirhabdus sediminis]
MKSILLLPLTALILLWALTFVFAFEVNSSIADRAWINIGSSSGSLSLAVTTPEPSGTLFPTVPYYKQGFSHYERAFVDNRGMALFRDPPKLSQVLAGGFKFSAFPNLTYLSLPYWLLAIPACLIPISWLIMDRLSR